MRAADLLFGNFFFLVLGAALPLRPWFQDYAPWQLPVAAAAILLLRRLPPVLALYRLTPDIQTLGKSRLNNQHGMAEG